MPPSKKLPRVVISKARIIESIKKCAERLGRRPTAKEFAELTKISSRQLLNQFDNWAEALSESGFEALGPGHTIPMRTLFENWATVVREMKDIPTNTEYQRRGRFAPKPFRDRFGSWNNVPASMREFAMKEGLEADWRDVMEVIDAHIRAQKSDMSAGVMPIWTGRGEVLESRSVYAPPLLRMALLSEPSNEAGVLFLFGTLARELGFMVMRVQTQFPDCEALYEVSPGKWQWVRIELEYESRNFLEHRHEISGCDMIVCWRHNWPECPLPVVELSKHLDLVVGKQRSAVGSQPLNSSVVQC